MTWRTNRLFANLATAARTRNSDGRFVGQQEYRVLEQPTRNVLTGHGVATYVIVMPLK